MDFLLYEPEDFASDESYLRYYFRLNDADIILWQGWISNHPEKLDCIINADQLICLLALRLDESELVNETQRLSLSINDLTSNEESGFTHKTTSDSSQPQTQKIKKTRLLKGLMAVAVIFVIATIVWFFTAPVIQDRLRFDGAKAQTLNLVKKTNDGKESSKFELADGSIITLQPGSVMNYPRQFAAAKREVYLQGEAFFEVSKNKNRPFYVYCENMVAHVLGTSFNIKADKFHGKVEVMVRTGKVEIYTRDAGERKELNKTSNGLILTPNQKAVYIEENNRFESSLVDTPLPIPYTSEDGKKDNMQSDTIRVKATLLSEILKSLEQTYGIEIEVENENIGNCHFYGDMLDMNLYVKLEAICQSLNATYEIKGTKILIRGKGCNW